MRRICIIGTGYVGLVTGACLADFGNVVTCTDADEEKIELLQQGRVPIYEPGLKELIQANTGRGRLSFSTQIPFAIKGAEIIFITVGTPSRPDGSVDLSQVIQVAEMVAEYMEDYKVIVNKSTVAVGTGAKIEEIIGKRQKSPVDFDVVSNPEFLREGSAIEDFMHPDRVIIGARSQKAMDIMADVYKALYLIEIPIIKTDIETAEMIKYASNAFLAMKISFINEIATICDGYGVNVNTVARAMGMDRRIGREFLHAGPGYGGSCFPKDTAGLVSIAQKVNVDPVIIKATIAANQRQKMRMLEKLAALIGPFEGKTVALLGLSFKPNTDDIREAPSLVMIEGLLKQGAKVKAFDPAAVDNAKRIFPQVEYCGDMYSAAKQADAVVLMTEWNEFRNIDLPRLRKQMRQPNFLDCRNVYTPEEMRRTGFCYQGVGQGGSLVKQAASH